MCVGGGLGIEGAKCVTEEAKNSQIYQKMVHFSPFFVGGGEWSPSRKVMLSSCTTCTDVLYFDGFCGQYIFPSIKPKYTSLYSELKNKTNKQTDKQTNRTNKQTWVYPGEVLKMHDHPIPGPRKGRKQNSNHMF